MFRKLINTTDDLAITVLRLVPWSGLHLGDVRKHCHVRECAWQPHLDCEESALPARGASPSGSRSR